MIFVVKLRSDELVVTSVGTVTQVFCFHNLVVLSHILCLFVTARPCQLIIMVRPDHHKRSAAAAAVAAAYHHQRDESEEESEEEYDDSDDDILDDSDSSITDENRPHLTHTSTVLFGR